MKFVNTGGKHNEYDYLDDAPSYEETAKPRWIPSYYNIAKKHRTDSASCPAEKE